MPPCPAAPKPDYCEDSEHWTRLTYTASIVAFSGGNTGLDSIESLQTLAGTLDTVPQAGWVATVRHDEQSFIMELAGGGIERVRYAVFDSTGNLVFLGATEFGWDS